MRTEALDFNVLFQNVVVLRTEAVATRDQNARWSPATGCARTQNESVRAGLFQKLTVLDLCEEREAVLKLLLDALKANMSHLTCEFSSLRLARREMKANVAHF